MTGPRFLPLTRAISAEYTQFNNMTLLPMSTIDESTRSGSINITALDGIPDDRTDMDRDGISADILTCDEKTAPIHSFQCTLILTHWDLASPKCTLDRQYPWLSFSTCGQASFMRFSPNSSGGIPNYLGNQPIAEVRYGDIDLDEDLDIAIKVASGAVYVFRNSEITL